jgi:hypothetical protein
MDGSVTISHRNFVGEGINSSSLNSFSIKLLLYLDEDEEKKDDSDGGKAFITSLF